MALSETPENGRPDSRALAALATRGGRTAAFPWFFDRRENSMYRSITLAALALVLALVAPTTAAADRPVVVEKQKTLTRDFPQNPDCRQYGYGFTYSEHFDIVRTVTQSLDGKGEVVREVRQIRFVGTATNDQTGKSLPVNGVRHLVFDFVAGTVTETGVLRHVTVPGGAIVLHESGRVVIRLEDEALLSAAGQHQLFAGDLSRFCAALAE